MNIFRLIRGEMQKTLLRPLMYVISIVLVCALLGSVGLFHMTDRQLTASGYVVAGDTKTDVYNNFLSSTAMNKTIADSYMQDARELIDYYTALNNDPTSTVSAKLKTLVTSANGELLIYQNNIRATSAEATDLSNLEQNRQNLINYCNQIKINLSTAVQGSNLTLLIEKNYFDDYIGLISSCLNYLNNAIDTNSLEDHKLLTAKIAEATGYTHIDGKGYLDKIATLTNQQITDVIVNKEIISNLNKQQNTATAYLNELNNKMAQDLDKEEVSLEQYKDTALAYYYTASQQKQLVKDSVYYYPIASFGDAKINQFAGYKNVNTYQLMQDITRNNYLISHNQTNNKVAAVFSPTVSFGDKVSALDVVYFGLEICGLIIIIICIVLIASMIAGETGKGTLKMLAVRPYTRNQILVGKILATLFFGIILLIFSALILFVSGWAMFGIDSTPVLAVFNATSAFVVSPFVLILIYIALFIVKLLFYIMLAALFATLFKNNIMATLFPILIYIANAVFAFLFASTYWYAFIPFACVDLFKFFGGSFVINNNPIAIALSTPIFYNSSFVYSICILLGSMILMSLISHLIFNKREIR